MKKSKSIHKSWSDRAMLYHVSSINNVDPTKIGKIYLKGANDFRKKALESLKIFTSLTNDKPVIYNNKVYVSLEDVTLLIEGLYAKTKVTKLKTKNSEKD